MKIVGGELKGRIISTPNIPDLRPSTEKIREAIFSALGGDIIGARVGDFFCGSGALGIEALSRGAETALFVDSRRAAVFVVRENLKLLDIANRGRAMTMNVFRLRPSHLENIGIIFADPPYRKGHASKLTGLLSLQKFSYNGILVLEHEADWRYAGDKFDILRVIDSGDTGVSFLRGKPEAPEGL